MTREMLLTTLNALAQRRPVFHSEADFQHDLAWLIRERGVASAVRLERPFDIGPGTKKERINLDLLATVGDQPVGIELKYWKRGAQINVNGEPFAIKNRAAQDISRYDFWWDVSRLERLRSEGLIARGFGIALASDPGYWREGRIGTVDAAFRLHDGRVGVGDLAWTGAGEGTMRGRELPIRLRGTYRLAWVNYSEPAKDHALRVLVVEVGAS